MPIRTRQERDQKAFFTKEKKRSPKRREMEVFRVETVRTGGCLANPAAEKQPLAFPSPENGNQEALPFTKKGHVIGETEAGGSTPTGQASSPERKGRSVFGAGGWRERGRETGMSTCLCELLGCCRGSCW